MNDLIYSFSKGLTSLFCMCFCFCIERGSIFFRDSKSYYKCTSENCTAKLQVVLTLTLSHTFFVILSLRHSRVVRCLRPSVTLGVLLRVHHTSGTAPLRFRTQSLFESPARHEPHRAPPPHACSHAGERRRRRQPQRSDPQRCNRLQRCERRRAAASSPHPC